MPLLFQKYKLEETFLKGSILAILSLVVSFFFEAGSIPSIVFSIPWLVLAVYFLFANFNTWWIIKKTNFILLKLLAGIFWVVGTSWLLADRIGFQPLGFDPTIVLLTAVHFHFAGFMLCSISYFILQKYSLKIQRLVLLGLSLGIPAVAAGITLSKIYGPSKIELVGATFMALTGIFIAILIIKFYTRQRRNTILGTLSGFCLFAGMCFSLLYAWRTTLNVDFVTIPWMWAVHGTTNALGFAMLGAIALKLNSYD